MLPRITLPKKSCYESSKNTNDMLRRWNEIFTAIRSKPRQCFRKPLFGNSFFFPTNFSALLLIPYLALFSGQQAPESHRWRRLRCASDVHVSWYHVHFWSWWRKVELTVLYWHRKKPWVSFKYHLSYLFWFKAPNWRRNIFFCNISKCGCNFLAALLVAFLVSLPQCSFFVSRSAMLPVILWDAVRARARIYSVGVLHRHSCMLSYQPPICVDVSLWF